DRARRPVPSETPHRRAHTRSQARGTYAPHAPPSAHRATSASGSHDTHAALPRTATPSTASPADLDLRATDPFVPTGPTLAKARDTSPSSAPSYSYIPPSEPRP